MKKGRRMLRTTVPHSCYVPTALCVASKKQKAERLANAEHQNTFLKALGSILNTDFEEKLK